MLIKLRISLRSILSMKDREVISLKEEIQIIETFYLLQKERFGNNLKLEINLPEDSLNMKIPPLALQMLVENAIKHNVITSEKPLTIQVSLCKSDRVCVSNNLQPKENKGRSSGLGLQNIRNRYSFLTDKEITITETQTRFEVVLPLLEG
jgi:LytS/YehU family sensor histidine kinase